MHAIYLMGMILTEGVPMSPKMDKAPNTRNPFIVIEDKLVNPGTPNGHLIADSTYTYNQAQLMRNTTKQNKKDNTME